MTITTYQTDTRFSRCPNAFLVTGTQEHDALNRDFLSVNRSGHWKISAGRIQRGDLLFFILPAQNQSPDQTERELYAGVVVGLLSSEMPNRKIVAVEHFFRLPNIEGSVMRFLEGKLLNSVEI